MGSHGTPSAVSGAFVNFVAALVKAAPRDGSDEQYLYWDDNGEELTCVLRSALLPPEAQAERAANPPPAPDLPTSFTVGDRTYDLVSFLKDGKGSVSGPTMVARATELEAELGEEDARHILERQSEIPAALRGKIAMVFPKWRYPDDPQYVAYLGWNGYAWYRDWSWLGSLWNDNSRLVRRRT